MKNLIDHFIFAAAPLQRHHTTHSSVPGHQFESSRYHQKVLDGIIHATQGQTTVKTDVLPKNGRKGKIY
jgi:hypothetical protein